MADNRIDVNAGTGPGVKARTTPEGDYQQVVVLGLPDTDAVIADLTPGDADTNSDVLPFVARTQDWNGSAWTRRRIPTVFKTLSATAIGTEATIWTPASGKKFRLMGFILASGTAAGAITLKDNTGGSTIFVIPKQAIDTPVVCPSLGNGILSGAADRVLTATGVATQTLTGTIFGCEE